MKHPRKRSKRTATGARRSTSAPRTEKPQETSISRQKLLEISRLDRKAALRAGRFSGRKLPKLREESKSRPQAPRDGKERLQKILASAGVCSRRKAEELILLGEVQVNGETVNTLGAKADPQNDVISVQGKIIQAAYIDHVYFVLNKPRGYVTTTQDPQGRPTVMDLMGGIKERIYPVGRLDYASEGLLLFTNDGELANRLMHPSGCVERTYAVKVRGTFTQEHLKRLRKGIQLSDGFVKPVRAWRGEHLQGKDWVYLTLTEGKNLEIRRIFAVLDLEVERLRRVAIGPLRIEDVPVGRYLKLTRRDILAILEDKSKEIE
ncbi:MAG: rRNA pseudouridine synthase [Bdellovibrionales bacterium]|nr:rRNA pseudouridine synthase [Bdellovibrionales bacterium]